MSLHRRHLFETASLALGAIASAVLPISASANPQGGQVVAGQATVTAPSSSTLLINQQSQKAIIDWNSFSIGSNEQTRFNQPNAASISLNRVTGGNPSQILGSLTSNGQVWLINPDGIAFGKTARVDVAGLLATTLDITNQDFLRGTYQFAAVDGKTANVTNAGQITIKNSGLAALVAPGVANSGLIEARLGRVQLASAAGFTVDFYGDGKFNFLLSAPISTALVGAGPTAAVSNSGSLIADGGAVFLTADAAKSVVDQSINMTGYIQARSVGTNQGVITLDGGSAGTVEVAGTLDASGQAVGQAGGSITLTGQDVHLASTASVDVSGDTGGGSVLIGGDLHGGGPLRDAITTEIDQGASVSADSLGSGNGGNVVVWSNALTSFAGSITSHGGVVGGNGGAVEVSGHQLLDFTGSVDLRAPKGLTGTLLLDPENVTIAATGDTPTLPAASSAPITFNPTVDDSILQASTLEQALALASVTVTTGSTGTQAGDITVATNLSWASNNALTLSANRNVIVDDGVTIANTGAANLNLRADATGDGVGTVTFIGAGKVDYSQSTGLVSIFYNPSDNPAASAINATSYSAPTNYGPSVQTSGAVGQFTAYMLVNTVNDLQDVQNNLYGVYALGRNINASGTASWNGGAGFSPIGGSNNFQGIFDGQAQTISGLTINSTQPQAGLFSNTLNATVRNVSLTNVSVTDNAASASVGALVGLMQSGTVSGAVVSGSVTGNGAGEVVGGAIGFVGQPSSNGAVVASSSFAGSVSGNGIVGGLVGRLYPFSNSVESSSSSGSVSGTGSIGGLVGFMEFGNVSDSYSSAAVTDANSPGNNQVGGLVGYAGRSNIQTSYATGSVTDSVGGTVSTPDEVGGLVGLLGGSITQSFAAGNVSAGPNAWVGGLVGVSGSADTSVISSHASGSATGGAGSDVGGLVGNGSAGQIYTSYATGAAIGGANSNVGGLVGYLTCFCGGPYNFGTVANSNATGSAQGGNFSSVGGLVGSGSGSIIQTSYSTGLVLGGSFANLGGLIGSGGAYQLTNAYWDINTSGQSSPGEQGTGLTDAQLKSGLPVGFDPTVWVSSPSANGSLPYLSANPPTSLLQGKLPPGFNPAIWQAGAGAFPRLKWQTTSGLPQPKKIINFAQTQSIPTLSSLLTDAVTGMGSGNHFTILNSPFGIGTLNQSNYNVVSAIISIVSPTVKATSYNLDAYGFIYPASYLLNIKYDAFIEEQCVALVESLAPLVPINTKQWIPVLQVSANLSSIAPGTPIATFSAGPPGGTYPTTNDHAAIFLGMTTRNNVLGMLILDQYNLYESPSTPYATTVAERTNTSNYSPLEVRFYPVTDQYYSTYYTISMSPPAFPAAQYVALRQMTNGDK